MAVIVISVTNSVKKIGQKIRSTELTMILLKFLIQWAGIVFVFITAIIMRRNCGWGTETYEIEATGCISDDVGSAYTKIGFWAEFLGKTGIVVGFGNIFWVSPKNIYDQTLPRASTRPLAFDPCLPTPSTTLYPAPTHASLARLER